MGSKLGVLKVAAKRIGMPFEDYMANLSSGLKWCTGCREWKPRDQFGKNKTLADGLCSSCLDCATRRYTTKEVGTRARRAKRAVGLYWCTICRDWRPKSAMAFTSSGYSSGLCHGHRREKRREYYASSPERRRKAYKAAKDRRAKAKPVSVNEKRRLLELFGGRCAYCEDRPFEEWDHFVPLKHGGKSIPGNVLPSCLPCNRSKHAENPFEWIEKQGSEFSRTVLWVVNTLPEQAIYKHRRNPNQGGELNPMARLTNKQAREIRNKFAAGEHNYPGLASEYGVGRWTIGRIVRGETYNGNQVGG